jgi:hypothetical protein
MSLCPDAVNVVENRMVNDDSELEGAGVLADQSWRRRNPSWVAGAEIHFSHHEAVDWTTGSYEAIFRHVDQANSQKMRPKPGSAVYQICIAKTWFIVYIRPTDASLLFPDKSLLTLLPQIVSSRSLVSIVRHLENSLHGRSDTFIANQRARTGEVQQTST